MKGRTIVGLLLIAAAGLMFRGGDLAQRPLHNDEAINAFKLQQLWRHGTYRYDPHEYHGPTLYYFSLPVLAVASLFQPDQPDALLQMADLNHDGGNDFQARAFLQRYMAIGPVNPQALWLGYRIERKLGDVVQSQEYARRLRTEFATSAETRELLEAEQGG